MKLKGIELIKALSDVFAPSGCEDKAAELIIGQIGKDAGTSVDRVGNVVAYVQSGKKGAPRVMLTAHMDEPGFLVKDVDGDGKVWMKFYGGVPTERISGRLGVINGTEKCIFSAKPIHQLSGDERSKPTAADRIYAELGFKDKETADANIKVGDYGAFAPSFAEVGGYYKGKALGSRAACGVMIELIRELKATKAPLECDVYFVFTTRGEVGNTGAEVAANVIAPDFAIALDGIQAFDTPDVPDELNITTLGGGAAVLGIDAKTVFHPAKTDEIMRLAEECGIKYQYVVRQSQIGEGAVTQRALGGRLCVGVAIPTRYRKSASEMISVADCDAAKALIKEIIIREGK